MISKLSFIRIQLENVFESLFSYIKQQAEKELNCSLRELVIEGCRDSKLQETSEMSDILSVCLNPKVGLRSLEIRNCMIPSNLGTIATQDCYCIENLQILDQLNVGIVRFIFEQLVFNSKSKLQILAVKIEEFFDLPD